MPDTDTIFDPAFRQRLRFATAGADTLLIEVWTEPGGGVGEHLHPAATERWTLLEGDVVLRLDGVDHPLSAGESLTAMPGVRHAFHNRGAVTCHMEVTFTPAGSLEMFLREAASLAATGAWDHRGRPRSLRGLLAASEMAHRHRDETVLTGFPLPPPRLQPLLFGPLAALERRRRGDGGASS